ncbi:MAG: chemotaxis protein CheW [Candidatus Methylacidiphilales bacterium]|nr:chemotaxis protein CheW [Candidatus Methylacidiphilales bacterium]
MKSYCLLQLRGFTCGVDLALVKEVLPALPLTLVPLGPECLLGAANLRSEIISVYAIEPLLQLEVADDNSTGTGGKTESGFAKDDRFLIVQHEEFVFGIRVRRVDTVRLPDEAEPLDADLSEHLLLHPSMQFEGYNFRVIELGHLVERLRTVMIQSLNA